MMLRCATITFFIQKWMNVLALEILSFEQLCTCTKIIIKTHVLPNVNNQSELNETWGNWSWNSSEHVYEKFIFCIYV